MRHSQIQAKQNKQISLFLFLPTIKTSVRGTIERGKGKKEKEIKKRAARCCPRSQDGFPCYWFEIVVDGGSVRSFWWIRGFEEENWREEEGKKVGGGILQVDPQGGKVTLGNTGRRSSLRSIFF
jgi:hypothetical protein